MMKQAIQPSEPNIFELTQRKSTSFAKKMKLNTSMALRIVIFSILLASVCPVNGRLVDFNSNSVGATEVVARCRATCLQKFLFDDENDVVPIDECLKQSHCAMCWDFCQFLYKEKRSLFKAMCTDPICVSINYDFVDCSRAIVGNGKFLICRFPLDFYNN